ncbi:hypothetical protein DXG03_003115 [Asterophora parasitica]|uniref:Uncharacterized protein n=1 Tax=Asterophora parasitica TaxID=117018 RepID=A0A9P7GDE8_9AGAR|nr:hypothetical protein DXG03_003115 [Asterophora parasitica]
MPKPHKKAPVVAARPLTDFFTRKSATLPASKLVSSQSENAKPFASPLAKSASNSSVLNFSGSSATKSTNTISDASSPATPRSRTFIDAVEIVSPGRSAKKGQYLMPPALVLRKCAKSPSVRSLSPLSPCPSPRSRSQRKAKFDSDSDQEPPALAVYVLRSPAPQTAPGATAMAAPAPLRATENLTQSRSSPNFNPTKRLRLSSPEPCSELAPTSQSDEVDMVPRTYPQRDPLYVKRSVDEWRHSAMATPKVVLDNDNVFMDKPAPARESLPHDEMSSLSPLPPSPKALNPTTKAEQIIAEIKARAYAATHQIRSETPVREFKDELSDSSDDDMLPESPIRAKVKRYATSLSMQCSFFMIAPSNVTGLSHQPLATSSRAPSGRYSLRNRDPSPSPSKSKHMSGPSSVSKRTRVASTCTPVTLTQAQKGKAKAFNPLDELLREKKRDDKRGKGSQALRQAEAVLASRDTIMIDVDDDDFANEAAAQKALNFRQLMDAKSSSPVAFGSLDSEDDLDDEDRKRLLGEENGKTIANILDSDRASKQREKESKTPLGIPLWQVDEAFPDLMDVDEVALPTLSNTKPNPVLFALQGAVKRKDIMQAALLVGSGVISSINLTENSCVIPYLCKLALSLDDTALSRSALQMLTHIWRTSIPPVPGITFACILSIFARLGAQSTALDAMGWPTSEIKSVPISSGARESVLYRLVALVTASAQSRRLSGQDTPDILMSMVLLANEPSSPPELQTDVMLAIDAVCGTIASGADISALEPTICTRLLKYMTTLQPVNKAYISALFGSGTGRTQRIARWIANGIIINAQTVTSAQYRELPPLLPLSVELMRKKPERGNVEYGKFEQHSNTNFVDMLFYVQILSVAATNIVGYTLEERAPPRPRFDAMDEMDLGVQDKPHLVLLKDALDVVHNKISDIRATHLDRSRTKAALKELALRIYYQRNPVAKSRGNISSYFSRTKPKPRPALRIPSGSS